MAQKYERASARWKLDPFKEWICEQLRRIRRRAYVGQPCSVTSTDTQMMGDSPPDSQFMPSSA